MKIRRKQREMRTHAGKWGILIIVAALCLVAYCGVQGVMGVVDTWTENLPSVHNEQAFAYSEKTRVYANDHTTLLAEFYLQDQEPVTMDQVSNYVLAGTVATEDERFSEHNGVDLVGIARALVNNLKGGSLEGASTITQQLVRNTLLSSEANEISLKRKVREAELSLQMEEAYSKDDILMMYINTINYGDGCYGIEAASRHYFQKSALDLTLVEAATLIGIPQSPTYNNPTLYPDNCLARRNVVLDRMFSNGVISEEEHDAAQAEPLTLNVMPPQPEDGIFLYPYFTSYVRSQLQEQLSYDEVFGGGLTVYTTIDPTIQGYAQDAIDAQYAEMNSNDNDVLLSLTCIDPNTGYIVAMIGGQNYAASEFNLATDASRQAGSSFKMFTLASAIEQGIDPQTKIDCSDGYKVSDTYTVHNINNASYGVRSLESATWVSSNTGFVRLTTDPNGVSNASILDMASRMGVKGDSAHGYDASYASLTLGIAQTNTLRMASAYGTLSTGGMYYKDTCITQILGPDGGVILDNTAPEGERVLSPEVSCATTEVLKGVVTQGTARGTALASGQVSAGKTGTSQEVRDLWFCGYTPQYSCAVWAGTDPERQMSQSAWCRNAWRSFMTAVLDGSELQDFPTADKPEYKSDFTKDHSTTNKDNANNTIDSLAGKSLAEIRATLGNVTVVEQYNDSVAAGGVIDLVYSNGTYIAYVSKGPDPESQSPQPEPQVPEPEPSVISASVVGMSESSALSALSAAGFGTAVVQYVYSDVVAAGTVISQNTTTGAPGDAVTIEVSSGPAPVVPPPSP